MDAYELVYVGWLADKCLLQYDMFVKGRGTGLASYPGGVGGEY